MSIDPDMIRGEGAAAPPNSSPTTTPWGRLAKGSQVFRVRMSKAVKSRLEMEARVMGVSASDYLRSVLVAHLSVVSRRNNGDLHRVGHRDVDRAVKEFILALQFPIAIAGGLQASPQSGLPGKKRRKSLEELAWNAVLEAVAYAKTQDDPKIRLLAMRVVSSIVRTELAILHEQDLAAVDELVAEVEGDRDDLAKKAGEGTRKETPA